MDDRDVIADLKRQLAESRESEARYRSLFDTMPEVFAICGMVRDPAGNVVDLTCLEWNQAFERQAGLDGKNLLGQQFSGIFPPADIANWMSL